MRFRLHCKRLCLLSGLLAIASLQFFSGLAAAEGSGSFSVVGNKVFTASGSVYIPEGISVYGGLEDTDYMENIPNINAQIVAAATYWHTNTIRLQVAESNLFSGLTPGKNYNVGFLNELKREVSLARSLNQAVVINDQTEFTTNFPSPTSQTLKFWQVMSSTFGNQPYIIFDLFNEPRLDQVNTKQPISTASNSFIRHLRLRYRNASRQRQPITDSVWRIWRYGGEANGIKYVGMQTLVNKIRALGVNNLLWVEGPDWARSLPGKKLLLSGSNIEYSYHHINLNRPSTWTFIGRMAATHAVVDGEWAQYQSPWEECYVNAPEMVPKYLSYLQQHDVGLIAWSLQAGSLLKGSPRIIPNNNNSPSDPKTASMLQTPSQFHKNYLCNNHFGEGAGKLVMQYFSANSAPVY